MPASWLSWPRCVFDLCVCDMRALSKCRALATAVWLAHVSQSRQVLGAVRAGTASLLGVCWRYNSCVGPLRSCFVVAGGESCLNVLLKGFAYTCRPARRFAYWSASVPPARQHGMYPFRSLFVSLTPFVTVNFPFLGWIPFTLSWLSMRGNQPYPRVPRPIPSHRQLSRCARAAVSQRKDRAPRLRRRALLSPSHGIVALGEQQRQQQQQRQRRYRYSWF